MRRDVEFLSGGVTLRGFFEVPDGADGPVPVICFAHGFSGVKELFLEAESDFAAGRIRNLGRFAPNAGIASVAAG